MQKIRILTIAGLAAVIASAPVTASDKQDKIDHCQYLKDKKDRYQQLRRKGGSGSQMDSWKRKMHDIDDAMTKNNCSRYWNKFK